MRLSPPDRLKMNREMVAEQCPAQLPALTASTHVYLYKKDANFAEPLPLRFAGGSCLRALQPLIHHRALRTRSVQISGAGGPAFGSG
ncbi:hypothetical protein RAVI111496_04870 [Rahnella victoriana]